MAFDFYDHHDLRDQHAYLSASKHSWVNYDDEHMRTVYFNELMKKRGTEMHAYAEMANRLGIRQRGNKVTIDKFINDGLDYDMKAEVVLYYSRNCFGTTDLIGYDKRKNLVRIFDLKNGKIPVTKFDQLHIYGALFCLEYKFDPMKLDFDFRLYQNDGILVDDEYTNEDIRHVMDKIIHFDEMIENMYIEAKSNRGIL